MKKKNAKRTQEKGITLIALVVTIVVLLILAGVSITVLFGDSGIIKMAQEAAQKTQEAADKDRADLAELDKYLTSGNWGGTTTPTDPEKPPLKTEDTTEQPTTENKGKILVGSINKDYIDENDKIAKIPVGFSVVKDLKDAEEKITDENNITRGLVISDVANDDLDNTAKGNQFVWIPVDTSNNMESFVRIEGFWKDARDSMLAQCQEAGKEGDTISTEESRKMYQSVAENGGFYIARFEAGVDGVTTPIKKDAAGKLPDIFPDPDGKTKPVSKKGVSPWNYIPWGGTTAKEASDGLQGNDNENGAVLVARSMYTKGSSCGAKSTLCYSVQWDAVMQFIDSNYLWKKGEIDNVGEDSFVRNSSGNGNYSGYGELKVTGQYQQNHIYDLAGNVFEWTMEAYGTRGYRVNRGGEHLNTEGGGAWYPASHRGNRTPDHSDGDYIGFRITLYL